MAGYFLGWLAVLVRRYRGAPAAVTGSAVPMPQGAPR
jgi:hypothetical protein